MNMQSNSLEIHIHLTDGTVSRFAFEDTDAARLLLDSIQPHRLFSTPEIIIGGSHSMTMIKSDSIDCIDFITQDYPGWAFAPKVLDAVEVKAETFHEARLSGSTHGLRSENIGLEGDLFDACIELVLSGGKRLYHCMTMASDPQSPVDRGLSLSHLFSRTVFVARRLGGGATIVNPAHVIQATFFPGTSETPPNAWLARHIVDEQDYAEALLLRQA